MIVVLIGHYVIEEIFVVILLGNLEFDDSDDGSPIIGIWMANILKKLCRHSFFIKWPPFFVLSSSICRGDEFVGWKNTWLCMLSNLYFL